ncbi:MAG: hypothetical protein H6835_09355 [Planctomycetes bacterium]|nr:hypothetical protein [Planctomycetota bacterium]
MPQGPIASATAPATPRWLQGVPSRSHGVVSSDGAPAAIGPGYAARFDERGVDYVPRPAGEGARVHMRWSAVARGDVVVWQRGHAATRPEVHGNEVIYRHSDELTERFESRVDGLEHSFVFSARPAGSGDLVVRIGLDTELGFEAAGRDRGARFVTEGIGAVTIGSVTGIDAEGLAVQGALRFVAGHLEYVLPAAFVDAACYPMVLDPLIGSVIAIGNAAGVDDVRPSVAYDESNARYLVVWNAGGGSVASDILGQFVSPTGALIGGVMSFGYGELTSGQSLANVNGVNRFLLGYINWTSPSGAVITTYLRVRAIDAGTGAMSNSVLLDSTMSYDVDLGNVAVGGDSRPVITQHTAMVAWHNSYSTQTKARAISVPLAGDPTTVGSQASLTYGNHRHVGITAFGGAGLRWMVTFTNAGSPYEIMASVLEGAANVCHGPVAVAGNATSLVDHPAVASSDGTNFLVAWHQHSGSGLDEIRMCTLTWSGACGAGTLTPGPELGLPSSGELRDQPALAFAKDKYVLTWLQQASLGSVTQAKAMGLDPTTCAACGNVLGLESGLSALITQSAPVVASRCAGGDFASDEALLCWSNLTIRGRLFEARGTGSATSLGGKCVAGGGGGGGGGGGFNEASYSGEPVIGNANFQLVLSSPTVPVLAAIIGFSQAGFPCGPCTLVPSLDVIVAGPGPVAVPLPCDVGLLGATFWSQWLLWSQGGCPLVPDFGLSDAMQFTIGE